MGILTTRDSKIQSPEDPSNVSLWSLCYCSMEPLTQTFFGDPGTGHVARPVTSPGQHLLAPEDVVSCCLDLSVPSISFRINGCPVQGVFEAFNLDGLFFPVVSFSAGIK